MIRTAHVVDLSRCERGNIALTFALVLPILLGAGGAAVDYGNAIRIRAAEASIADATALHVASAETAVAATEAIRLANAQLVARLGDQSATGGYTIDGKWLDPANYRIVISMTMKTSLVHLLPGMPKTILVRTATTVNRVAPVYETKAPTMTQISPEAADYNRIYVYCYSSDPKRQAESDRGRRGITAIADNGSPPTDYGSNVLPTCKENEALSYMLRNVRNARSTRSRWNETGTDTYNYYTDISIDPITRVQTMSMKGSNMGNGTAVDVVRYPMLETVICDTEKQCKPPSDGGTMVEHKAGTPGTLSGVGCTEGKFIYYGWEDRPGGDQDYNDIRMVVACPKRVKVSDKKLRIVE
ncbi:TadE/TadG family type IV pilus assembly protein [Methylobacterium planeticum]|nr:TadE/TadG family type IV pilus assembly protein [Methylobacterium planeticum]